MNADRGLRIKLTHFIAAKQSQDFERCRPASTGATGMALEGGAAENWTTLRSEKKIWATSSSASISEAVLSEFWTAADAIEPSLQTFLGMLPIGMYLGRARFSSMLSEVPRRRKISLLAFNAGYGCFLVVP